MTLNAALLQLVAYNWHDELEDYQDNCGTGPDDNQRAGHIFETLVFLDNLLEGTDNKPEDYLPKGTT